MKLPLRSRGGRRAAQSEQRGLVSLADWRSRRFRWSIQTVHGLTLVLLLIVGLGPIMWLAKAAITPTQDTLRQPMALWPNGWDLNLLVQAFTTVHIERYFMNTVWIAIGSWICQITVATTAGYALSVLRPKGSRILYGLVLATLFVPSIVLLVPLYLTVWLPAGAGAFNVVIIKRFFDNLPREIFEAAKVDGAGPFRLFWSICLPMSRPIVGVVSVFAVIGTWKDYLWPMLVLPTPAMQPLSVRLPTLERGIQLDLFLASLAIATLFPIALFLIFQRMFLKGDNLSGAIKG